ncbi:hypothetical protein [Pseudoalteromonas sp. ASV78]|uniref:hypothetical protein n=1 Tax=Pseudoalteromonas sp. ASV78 TaxID=3397851 RepID=UPI0039FC7336
MDSSKLAFLEKRVSELEQRMKEREAECLVLEQTLITLLRGLSTRRVISLQPLILHLAKTADGTVTPNVAAECEKWVEDLLAFEETIDFFM